MSIIIKKGQPFAYTGPGFLEWVRGRGLTSGAEYACATKDEAMGVFSTLRPFVRSVRAEQIGDGPSWKVSASIEGEETPEESIVDTHELDGGEYQNDVRFNPKLKTLLSEFQIFYVDGLERKRDSEKSRTEAYKEIDDASEFKVRGDGAGATTKGSGFPGVQNGLAKDLWDDLAGNNDKYEVSTFDYVHTVSLGGPNQSYFANYDNINRIFTSTSQLLNFEGKVLPSDFVLPLFGQWRKRTPRIVSAYGQRTQVIYRYAWAESWDQKYYDFAV